MKDCFLLVKHLYKKNDCALATLQKLRILNGMKKGVSPVTVQGLLKMIKKFEKTGVFDVQSVRGKKRIDSTEVEEVAIAVEEE